MPGPSHAGAVAEERSVARVRAAVRAALAAHPHVVLAVSGGRDSVVLLDAALAVAPDRVRLVATFDHGTGAAARRAVRHVRALGRAAGVPTRVGRTRAAGATEAEWRAARWRFLRRAARTAGDAGGTPAVVATGHTADDQLETVVMRLLRGAGARGLAAMYAPAPGIVRPLLAVAATEVAAYAAACGLAWVDDPSNASRRHLRNRVRHELLPALLGVRPALGADLLSHARAAATCRRALDAVVARLAARCPPPTPAGTPSWVSGARCVATLADLAECVGAGHGGVGVGAATLAALWPAMAARAGVRLDRRGTARLAVFTRQSLAAVAAGRAPPGAAQVAGGVRVLLERCGPPGSPEWVMIVRGDAAHPAEPTAEVTDGSISLDAAALGGAVWLGAWRFRALRRAPRAAELDGGRVAWLAAGRRYEARAWQPGDRWRAAPDLAARRVKRFLADRRVPAEARVGWPVVLAAAPDGSTSPGPPAADGAAGGEIVWIPGVRRSRAAPDRPGQPGFYLLCERTPERRGG